MSEIGSSPSPSNAMNEDFSQKGIQYRYTEQRIESFISEKYTGTGNEFIKELTFPILKAFSNNKDLTPEDKTAFFEKANLLAEHLVLKFQNSQSDSEKAKIEELAASLREVASDQGMNEKLEELQKNLEPIPIRSQPESSTKKIFEQNAYPKPPQTMGERIKHTFVNWSEAISNSFSGFSDLASFSNLINKIQQLAGRFFSKNTSSEPENPTNEVVNKDYETASGLDAIHTHDIIQNIKLSDYNIWKDSEKESFSEAGYTNIKNILGNIFSWDVSDNQIKALEERLPENPPPMIEAKDEHHLEQIVFRKIVDVCVEKIKRDSSFTLENIASSKVRTAVEEKLISDFWDKEFNNSEFDEALKNLPEVIRQSITGLFQNHLKESGENLKKLIQNQFNQNQIELETNDLGIKINSTFQKDIHRCNSLTMGSELLVNIQDKVKTDFKLIASKYYQYGLSHGLNEMESKVFARRLQGLTQQTSVAAAADEGFNASKLFQYGLANEALADVIFNYKVLIKEGRIEFEVEVFKKILKVKNNEKIPYLQKMTQKYDIDLKRFVHIEGAIQEGKPSEEQLITIPEFAPEQAIITTDWKLEHKPES